MISFPQSYIQHYPPSNDDTGIMHSMRNHIVPGMTFNIIIPPLHAKTLDYLGWTKQDIRDFLKEHTRVLAARRGLSMGQENPKLFKGRVNAKEGDTVSLIQDTRVIRVLVAGGPGSFIAHAIGGGPTPGCAEIQKIEFPANWKKLVNKYKSIVPNHVRY
jgi:hypothetical protein